jgi:hypothetical protein
MNFYESQKFPLRQIAVALLVPPSIMTLLLLWQVVLGHHWKGQSISNGDAIFWTIFLWLVYLRLITVRLITKVTGDKLEVKLRGLFRRRRIPLADIRTVETITLDPVHNYGSKMWLANSTTGVSLKLADGEVFILGTHKPAELVACLR